ncbi:uncharacterized protein LOC144113854 isoform X2 [Amblyomma americanum]
MAPWKVQRASHPLTCCCEMGSDGRTAAQAERPRLSKLRRAGTGRTDECSPAVGADCPGQPSRNEEAFATQDKFHRLCIYRRLPGPASCPSPALRVAEFRTRWIIELILR